MSFKWSDPDLGADVVVFQREELQARPLQKDACWQTLDAIVMKHENFQPPAVAQLWWHTLQNEKLHEESHKCIYERAEDM